MRAVALLLVFLTSACSHVQVNYGSVTTPAGAAVVTSGGGSVYAQGAPALLLLGAAVLATAADSRTSSTSSFMTVTDPSGRQIPPAMLVDRIVAEVDCTKPIEDWSANLKCR